jgi:hypothetical protein
LPCRPAGMVRLAFLKWFWPKRCESMTRPTKLEDAEQNRT